MSATHWEEIKDLRELLKEESDKNLQLSRELEKRDMKIASLIEDLQSHKHIIDRCEFELVKEREKRVDFAERLRKALQTNLELVVGRRKV
jgi:hypothetical protein